MNNGKENIEPKIDQQTEKITRISSSLVNDVANEFSFFSSFCRVSPGSHRRTRSTINYLPRRSLVEESVIPETETEEDTLMSDQNIINTFRILREIQDSRKKRKAGMSRILDDLDLLADNDSIVPLKRESFGGSFRGSSFRGSCKNSFRERDVDREQENFLSFIHTVLACNDRLGQLEKERDKSPSSINSSLYHKFVACQRSVPTGDETQKSLDDLKQKVATLEEEAEIHREEKEEFHRFKTQMLEENQFLRNKIDSIIQNNERLSERVDWMFRDSSDTKKQIHQLSSLYMEERDEKKKLLDFIMLGERKRDHFRCSCDTIPFSLSTEEDLQGMLTRQRSRTAMSIQANMVPTYNQDRLLTPHNHNYSRSPRGGISENYSSNGSFGFESHMITTNYSSTEGSPSPLRDGGNRQVQTLPTNPFVSSCEELPTYNEVEKKRKIMHLTEKIKHGNNPKNLRGSRRRTKSQAFYPNPNLNLQELPRKSSKRRSPVMATSHQENTKFTPMDTSSSSTTSAVHIHM